MNKTSRWIAFLFLLLTASVLVGCGSPPPPPQPSAPTALSLDEWRAMTVVEEKYDGATLDRLRMSDPQLQNERNWAIYMNQHVVPERKKDIPYAPGQQPP